MPTNTNTWLKQAKQHLAEAHSDLHMLANDLETAAQDPEAPQGRSTRAKYDAGQARNIACSVASLQGELNDRFTGRLPESTADLKHDPA